MNIIARLSKSERLAKKQLKAKVKEKIKADKKAAKLAEKKLKAESKKNKQEAKHRKGKKASKKAKHGLFFSKKSKKKIVKAMFHGDRGFTSAFGYVETEPYLFVEGHVLSIFDVIIGYGTNNPDKVGWMTKIIPRDQLNSGDVRFVWRQHGMEKDTETDIMDKKLRASLVTTANTSTDSAKQDAQNASRISDMQIAEQLAGQDDTIIDTDVRLIVRASTPERVEQTIKELHQNYKNYDIKGIMFIRRTGVQLQELKYLFNDIDQDAWHSSDMVTVAAGRLPLPSSGFSDTYGTYVGTDTHAMLAGNPAVIDFSGIKNAIIFMGGTLASGEVLQPGQTKLKQNVMIDNSGSAVAHVITESAYLNGQRTHHIVLSDFPYQATDSRYFDMSRSVINPIEVFGTPETVAIDANANITKLVTMLRYLTKMDDNRYIANDLNTIITDWYINQAGGNGIYTEDPARNPLQAQRILATPEGHKNYPKAQDLILGLNSWVSKVANDNGGGDAERDAKVMRDAIKNVFMKYHSLFAEPTNIPDQFKSNERNIYYDLSHVTDDKRVLGALFMNVLAYVTNRCLPGEIVVIHGFDKMELPSDEALLPYRERLDRKNCGLITVFEEAENKNVNPSTFQRFVKRMSQQDMVVLGGLTEEELNYINTSWRQPLPSVVSDELLEAQNRILYFYRRRDRVGALVQTHLLL